MNYDPSDSCSMWQSFSLHTCLIQFRFHISRIWYNPRVLRLIPRGDSLKGTLKQPFNYTHVQKRSFTSINTLCKQSQGLRDVTIGTCEYSWRFQKTRVGYQVLDLQCQTIACRSKQLVIMTNQELNKVQKRVTDADTPSLNKALTALRKNMLAKLKVQLD